MRLLLIIRDTNWPAVFSLLLLIAAPIVTFITAPEFLGLSLGISAVALASLSSRD